MTPADLYQGCSVSAYRLETLQHYDVTGDERYRAFHAGQPLPSPGPGKVEDLRLIKRLTGAGRKVGRIHVIDQPLTDYLRYELAVYAENAAAGEDVRITERTADPDLLGLRRDFAVFDAETKCGTAIVFDYSAAGRVLSYRANDHQGVVQRFRELYDLALTHSVPLAEFITAGLAT
jgi:hypothetical protein